MGVHRSLFKDQAGKKLKSANMMRMRDAAKKVRQQKSVREKKKFGPTKAEIVTKFLEELKASTGKKKYTLNDLVAKKRQEQNKGGEFGEGSASEVPTLKDVTELLKIKGENEEETPATIPTDSGEVDTTEDLDKSGIEESTLTDAAANLSVSSSGSESSSDDD